jgi:hypothetical protein
MGIFSSVVGSNNRTRQSSNTALPTLKPTTGGIYPVSSTRIQSGEGKRIAQKALADGVEASNSVWGRYGDDILSEEKNDIYACEVWRIHDSSSATPEERFIAEYSLDIAANDPASYTSTWKPVIARLREDTLAAIASPIPGTAGQVVAYLATQRLPADAKADPARKKHYQTEALNMIAKSPIVEPEEKKLAKAALSSNYSGSAENALTDIVKSDFHSKTVTLPVNNPSNLSRKDMENFLEPEEKNETKKPEPTEKDGKVKVGDTWVSKRKQGPPPSEIGLFQIKNNH